MKLFKTSKKQPIKFRGFTFIGYHKDYPVAYYYKEIGRDNFEIMECVLEGFRKPEIGAGTTVKVLDAFMSNYLYSIANNIEHKDNKAFIKSVLETTYKDFTDKQKEEMLKKFTSKVPAEIKEFNLYKNAIKDGYEILYCSNDETKERKMGIVNLTMVKEIHLVSEDKRLNIDRKFTIFKPLKYRVSPNYLKNESKIKYIEEDYPAITICHDILE